MTARDVAGHATGSVRRLPRPSGLGRLLLRATQLEVAGWKSMGRFLTRRPRVPAGASAFSYDVPFRPILTAFLCVSIVEVVVVDLITQPWPWVRLPLLVLGVWGVLFMLGMLLGYRTRPHAVGPDGIRLRNGGEVDIDLPWEVIYGVTPRRRRLPEAPALCLSGPPEDQILHQVVEERTDIEIVLEHPLTIALPQGPVTVSHIHLAVDQPREFADAVRRHIP